MSLQGIDTASYQAGLDPAKVPLDFNIVKATQGVAYINPDFTRMAQATLRAGKLLGVYHYAQGGDPIKEANFFLRTIPGNIGKAILALDWEGIQNPTFGTGKDVRWVKRFCDHVRESTGVKCFVYMSKSVCLKYDWTAVAKDYPLWCAQYASMERTGYQDKPWTDPYGFGAWKKATIYQYSSGGDLLHWDGRLDLDIAHLTAEQWKAMATPGKTVEAVVPFHEKTDGELALEVWADRHGEKDARRKALGLRYDAVQREVEVLAEAGTSTLMARLKAYEKKHGALFK